MALFATDRTRASERRLLIKGGGRGRNATCWGLLPKECCRVGRTLAFLVFLSSPMAGLADDQTADQRERLYEKAGQLAMAGYFAQSDAISDRLAAVLRADPAANSSLRAKVERLRLFSALKRVETVRPQNCVPAPDRLVPLAADARAAAEDSGDPGLIASITHLAANAMLLSGRYRSADELSRLAADHYHTSAPCLAAMSRRVGASALLLERDLSSARTAIEEAGALTRDTCPAAGVRDQELLRARAMLLEGLYQEAETILQGLLIDAGSDRSMILYHLAEVEVMRGRYPEAELTNDRARRTLEDIFPDHPVLAQIAHRAAIIRQELGDWSEADRAFSRATEVLSCQLGPAHPSTLSVRREHSRLLSRMGETDAAIIAAEALLNDAAQTPLPAQEAALNQAAFGLILHEAAEHDRAAPHLKSALATMASLPGTVADQTPALVALADISMRAGQLDRARDHAMAAITILEALGSQSIQRLGRARRVLADIEAADGNEAAALRIAQANLDGIQKQVATERRLATYTAELRPQEIRRQVEQAMALVWRLSDKEQALGDLFHAMEILHQAMGAHTGPIRQGPSHLEERALMARIQGLERLVRAPSGMSETLQRELDAARDALDSYRVAEANESDISATAQIGDIQTALADDQAVWVHATFDSVSYAMLVTPDGAAAARIDLTAGELADMKATLRAELDMSHRRWPKPADFPVRVAHGLYCAHFGVFSHDNDCATQSLRGSVELRSGVELFVMPDQSLQEVALSALLTKPLPEAPSAQDLRSAAWLARRHPLTTILSLDALRSSKANAPSGTRAFFGAAPFGPRGPSGSRRPCPEDSFAGMTNHTSTELGALDPTFAAGQAELRETVELLDTAAAIFGADPDKDTLRCGDATEARLTSSDLGGVDLLLLATHAEVGQLPAKLPEPGLFLAPPSQNALSAGNDGYLRASEIAALHLNARLVVLSACSTGSDSGLPGAPGLSGIAQAFFRAGAHAVAVSHWDVTSTTASDLFVRFFKRLQADPDEALSRQLQAAMLRFLDADQHEEYAHPFVWAPFFIVKGG